MNESIVKQDLKFDSRELVVMSNLYLSTEFPYNFTTLEEIAKLLNVSKATALNVAKELEKKGCLTKQKAYITFYYPIADKEKRDEVLQRLGFK